MFPVRLTSLTIIRFELLGLLSVSTCRYFVAAFTACYADTQHDVSWCMSMTAEVPSPNPWFHVPSADFVSCHKTRQSGIQVCVTMGKT
jgi:hypothetical protein